MILVLTATACSSDGSEEYPNLNTVPTSPGSSDSLAEARKIEEGLIADRANARYTDEVLRADTSVQAPLTPPPPKIEVEEVKEEVTEEVIREEPQQEEETSATETVEEEAEARAVEQTEEADAAATATQSAASAASSTEAPSESAPANEVTEETETEVTVESVEESNPDTSANEEPVTAQAEPAPVAEASKENEKEVEKVDQAQVAASEAPAVETPPATQVQPEPGAKTVVTTTAEETEVAAIAEDTVREVPSYRELANQPPLEIIFFEQGSNRINLEDSQKLTRIAQSQLAEGGKLKIVGHASSRTRELSASEYMIANLKASQQRAAAVAEALMKLGVSGDDLVLESVSDSFPLSRGGRPSDEARNRRAEIFLLN